MADKKQKAKIKNVQLKLDPDEAVLALSYDMYKYDPDNPAGLEDAVEQTSRLRLKNFGPTSDIDKTARAVVANCKYLTPNKIDVVKGLLEELQARLQASTGDGATEAPQNEEEATEEQPPPLPEQRPVRPGSAMKRSSPAPTNVPEEMERPLSRLESRPESKRAARPETAAGAGRPPIAEPKAAAKPKEIAKAAEPVEDEESDNDDDEEKPKAGKKVKEVKKKKDKPKADEKKGDKKRRREREKEGRRQEGRESQGQGREGKNFERRGPAPAQRVSSRQNGRSSRLRRQNLRRRRDR